ncbi:hypothetical protein AB0J28_13925 [Streptosporangium canum]|uniref:hypothetical protein n=1 Tax=Streptosporangium canum TaxID=324952 RepID=UPI003449E2F4
MNLDAVAAAHEQVAFSAYFSLVSPALREAAHGALRRARHNGKRCTGVDGTHWCDECEQTFHDRLLAGYAALRKALAGAPPRTRTGDPVRELELVAGWFTSPEAIGHRIDLAARLLRRRPGNGEPAEIRAARAQLVHHPLMSLEAQVRRDDAVRRGASAQPVRDLRKSAWAKPLREDEVAFELLVDAVVRLRNGATDPYDIPADRLGRHGLDLPAARRSLRASLDRLRLLRPAFHLANVTLYMEHGEFFPELFQGLSRDPEELLVLDEEKRLARRTVSAILSDGRRPDHRVRYRVLLARICETDSENAAGLLPDTADGLGISPVAAARFVRRLVRLICQAGPDWVADQCRAVESA